ncbi:hypothetical protein C3L33_16276, partial [Rhododendron williamsianum]
MVDLSDKGSESEEMNSSSSTSTDKGSTEGNQIKTCVDCGTSKTPLWRGGPSGPKRKLLALGKEAMWRRSTVEKLRRKLGEEEQAAVLLMALSCGSVYA